MTLGMNKYIFVKIKKINLPVTVITINILINDIFFKK